MVATAPHYALAQAQDAAHGGEGWRSREGTTADELGSIWAACGVSSECGTLGAVLMHRPGAEIDGVVDAASALWHDLLDPARARDQHDRLADLYRAHGVAVHELGEVARDKPNSYFCRDVFAMTPLGAILARPASASRVRHGMANNMVPLAPGVVVMPAGNPVTRAALEGHGVTCIEVEGDELMKGAGSVHCMTGVVHREAV